LSPLRPGFAVRAVQDFSGKGGSRIGQGNSKRKTRRKNAKKIITEVSTILQDVPFERQL
jgi:hypothetical protein